MKLIFLSILMLVSGVCFAQKQITSFPNSKSADLFPIRYQSKINDKLIFSRFTPEAGWELWVSDGTSKNTKLLKDITPGSNSSSFQDFTEYKNELYFRNNSAELWKTDGSEAGTKMVLRSERLSTLYSVNNKLLMTFSGDGLQRVPRTLFAWLNESNNPDVWENDATTFKVVDKTLYYSTFDTLSSQWTLKKYLDTPRQLLQQSGSYVQRISLEKYNGFEYISVYESESKRHLLVADLAAAEEKVTVYPWGSGYAPFALKDSLGSLFLINDHSWETGNKSIQVYKVQNGNSWQELANNADSKIYSGLIQQNEGPYHANFSVDGNTISFISLYGFESVYRGFLNVYDFKNNQKRVSKALPNSMFLRDGGLIIKPKTRNRFQLGYGGNSYTYDFTSDTIVSAEIIPPVNIPIQAGNQTFEVSDNLYRLTTTGKEALLQTKEMYEENYLAHRDTLNNKLLFWTFSQDLNKSILWVSDGNSTKEIAQYEGSAPSYDFGSKIGRLKNNIIFTSYTQKGLKIFRTDGTVEGTKELYTFNGDDYAYLEKTHVNDQSALFEINSGGKRVVINTNLEEAKEIPVSQFQYFDILKTSSNFYVVHQSVKIGRSYPILYKIENGALKLIDLNKKPSDDAMFHATFENHLYFTVRNSSGEAFYDILSLDSDDKLTTIFRGTNKGFQILGKYIIVNSDKNTVLKPVSGKVIYSSDISYTNFVYANSSLSMWSPRKMVMINNDQKYEYSFTHDIEPAFPTPQGFLIKGLSVPGYSYYFFYNKTKKLVPIIKNQDVYFDSDFSKETLIFPGNQTSRSKNFIWDLNNERLIAFPGNLWLTRQLNNKMYRVVEDANFQKPQIYALENDVLTRKYALEDESYSELLANEGANYFPWYTSATGFEVSRLDKDSVYHFPEIVKGPEGISLQDVFHFGDGVYASGFTFSKGLQVWKMGDYQPEEKEEEKWIAPVLPKTPFSLPDDLDLNTYPNPFIRELNIASRLTGKVQVLDAKGRIIYEAAANQKSTIDLKNSPSGQYIILFINEQQRLIKKVIKL